MPLTCLKSFETIDMIDYFLNVAPSSCSVSFFLGPLLLSIMTPFRFDLPSGGRL